jgi:hypothetical protein|tara:strand:+ start:4570 stop:5130 length:561 start_codon:yes stop_codon:yes gene_type:complete
MRYFLIIKHFTKLTIIFSFLLSMVLGQTVKPKNYRSIGFLDHKTGFSLLGYARTLKTHKKNEFFAGVGTLIAANTLSLGWKYSFIQKPVIYDPNTGDPITGFSTGLIDDYYVVASIQSVAGMGGGFVAPFFSAGFEKRLTKKIYINIGINSMLRIYDGESVDDETGEIRPAQEFVSMPTLHINYRY